jgi:hypothetical protein
MNGVTVDVVEGYTATLGLMTVSCDGSGEQLQGIYVTRSQIEQIRDEIDNYLLAERAQREPKLGIDESLRKPEVTPMTSNFNVNITGVSKFSKEEHEQIGKLLLEIAQRIMKTQGSQTNGAEQKQKLKVNPKLVWIEQSDEISSKPYCARISE